MYIRIMKYVPRPNEDDGILMDQEGPPLYVTLLDRLKVSDLPTPLGRQEMTFEGIEGIDPNTVFHVERVRRHYKLSDPDEDRPVRRSLGWTPPEPPFIDATVYVRI